MAERRLRDLDDLARRLRPWCSNFRGRPCDLEVRRPSSGWSNETLLLSLSDAVGVEDIVVRLPGLIPALPDNRPATEAAVLDLLRARGVPAPKVLQVEQDPEWLGVPFLVMERVAGRAVGEAPGLDPWLVDAEPKVQRQVQDQFVGVLAEMHQIGVDDGSPPTLRRGLGEEFDFWDAYVQWAADGSPSQQIRDVLAWCRTNAPNPDTPAVLLWGDPRLGNMLYDETNYQLIGLLDFELASFGPPEMDLAWYLQMEELTARSAGSSPPGFHTSQSLLSSYAERSDRDLADMGWHMVFALTRAAAINDREARIAERVDEKFPGMYGEGHFLLRRAERIMSGSGS